MNKFSSLSLLAALAASSMAFGAPAYTTPVGYVTETLKSGQFNLIGLTLQNSVVASGVIDAESATSITDTESNFTTLLTAGSTYILELPDGTLQEITSWTGSQLTTPQNVTSFVTPGTTTFKIRKAPTIADVFGAANSAGLQGTDTFNPELADVIYLPNGTGGFNRYFYSTLANASGWFSASNLTAGGNIPIVYADGILILRRGADLPLVLSGSVKTQATTLVLASGQFNYVGGVYPVGSTLASTGLSTSVTGTDSFNPELADVVYIPNGNGGYNRYFYSNSSSASGWFNASNLSAGDNVSVTSGVIILRRGSDLNATLNAPAGYAGLN